MSEYRRYYIKGGTWFFTVNLRNRRSQLLTTQYQMLRHAIIKVKEGANKRGNSSRLTQSFHFFMFEPIFSPVNALNQPI